MSQFYARNSTESVQKTVTNQYKNEKKQYGISTKRKFQEKRINSGDFLLKLGAFCPRARAKPGVPYFSSPHRPRQQNMLPAVGSRRQLKQPPFGTPCPCAAYKQLPCRLYLPSLPHTRQTHSLSQAAAASCYQVCDGRENRPNRKLVHHNFQETASLRESMNFA